MTVLRCLTGCMLMGFVVGCHGYPVRPMPQVSAESAPARSTLGGVKIGAKAYADSSENQAIFNADLIGHGVLPVLLVVDNDGSSEVEILRSRVELQTPNGQRIEPIAADSATNGQGRNALAEAVFFFGIFSYDDANKYNDQMRRDWIEKGYGEVTELRPGRTVSKFLYFNTGQNFRPSGTTLYVSISLTENGPRKTVTLRF